MFFRWNRRKFGNKNLNKRKERVPLPELKRKKGSCSGRISVSASLTLEAALVLPLFFCAVLAMLYFADAVTLQVRLMNGIRETGREMAAAAAAKDLAGIENSEDLGLAGTVLSEVYAAASVRKKAGELPSRVMKGEILLLGSSFLENEMIDLKVSGLLKIPVPFFGIRSIRYWQRGYVRAWTGRDPKEKDAGDADDAENSYVYVTATGTVYHTSEDCTHLKLSIRQVKLGDVSSLRSEDGSKYHACSCYKESPSALVYITNEGVRYHSSLECNGLKRTVQKVELSELPDLKQCLRCQEQE